MQRELAEMNDWHETDAMNQRVDSGDKVQCMSNASSICALVCNGKQVHVVE